MRLYHGTNCDFAKIELQKSKVGKDFGAGFYLTPDRSVALRQAQRKLAQYGFEEAIVQAYEWDEAASCGFNLLRFDGYSLEWATFILQNRKNRTLVQLHNYDIVVGPIADDTVGFQIRRVEDGIISMNQFLEEIKFNRITTQYFFATLQSLETLRRV